jgi:hypothetical protein
MNEVISKAAAISDAAAAFFENPDFKAKLTGKGTFSMVSMMLRDYPDESMRLICAYHGVDRDDIKDDAKVVFDMMATAVTGTTSVFQR